MSSVSECGAFGPLWPFRREKRKNVTCWMQITNGNHKHQLPHVCILFLSLHLSIFLYLSLVQLWTCCASRRNRKNAHRTMVRCVCVAKSFNIYAYICLNGSNTHRNTIWTRWIRFWCLDVEEITLCLADIFSALVVVAFFRQWSLAWNVCEAHKKPTIEQIHRLAH